MASRNGSKVNKIQVDRIENRNPDIPQIEIGKGLIGDDYFGNTDPNAFVQRQDLNTFIPSSGDIEVIYSDLSGDGSTVFTLPELVGSDVKMIDRGTAVRVILTGTPGPNDVLFDSTLGQLTFGSPFSTFSEMVRIVGYSFNEVIPGMGTYYVDGYIADGYTV